MIRSTPASALGDARTTITTRPRARTLKMAARERLVTLAVEIGIGLIEHDQENGLP